ncbi:MAG TPA: methyltransferase [Acidimicrobiales bacterium]|nr:methyltransferase [Acidimicrobiales bacterium]
MNIGTPPGFLRIPFKLPGGEEVELETDRGLFSVAHVDPGTKVLLAKAPPPPAVGNLVDIGCGYGPISIALARQSPEATVWAVDVAPRARELTAANARRLGAGNVRVVAPEEAPKDLRVAAIYSNPPLHTGKPHLHSLLREWLGRLEPDGAGWLVVKRSLGSDSLIRWLSETGFPATKLGSRKGYRVIEVHPSAPAS